MSGPPRPILPVLLPPDADARGALVHDLMGRGLPVAALPRLAFVLQGEGAHLPAGSTDPWLADVKKVRATALANLARQKPRWTDVRDAQGAVVAVALTGPHAPVRVLDPKAVKEAARLVGAQEVWLAWTDAERLEAVDAWRAPVAELGDALRARAHGGSPVLVARKGKVHGMLGPGGRTLPLPEPEGDAEEAPTEGPPGPPAPTARGGVAIVLFFVLVGIAAAALALATS